MTTKQWTPISSSKGMWYAGLMAIVHMPTGRAYVIGTKNVGKRYWDHQHWLAAGTHPCPALQAAWSAEPQRFGWFLVRRVAACVLLRWYKQELIRELRSADRCYNAQNAMPTTR